MEYEVNENCDNSNSQLSTAQTSHLTELSADYLSIDKGPYRQSIKTLVVRNSKTITYDTYNVNQTINNLNYSEKNPLPIENNSQLCDKTIDRTEYNETWNSDEEDIRSNGTGLAMYASTVTLSKPCHSQKVWFDRNVPKKHSVYTEKSSSKIYKSRVLTPMPNIIQMSEKTTCCRPGRSSTQQYMHRVAERYNRLRGLVKKIVEAREREKQTETWNNYINDLKAKYGFHEAKSITSYTDEYSPSIGICSQKSRLRENALSATETTPMINDPMYSRYLDSFRKNFEFTSLPISSHSRISKRRGSVNTVRPFGRGYPTAVVPKDCNHRKNQGFSSLMLLDRSNQIDEDAQSTSISVRQGDFESNILNDTTESDYYNRTTSITNEILLSPCKRDEIQQVGSNKIQKSRTAQKSDISSRQEMSTQDSIYVGANNMSLLFKSNTKSTMTYRPYGGVRIILQNLEQRDNQDEPQQDQPHLKPTEDDQLEENDAADTSDSLQMNRLLSDRLHNKLQDVQQNEPERDPSQRSQLKRDLPQASQLQKNKSLQNEPLNEKSYSQQSQPKYVQSQLHETIRVPSQRQYSQKKQYTNSRTYQQKAMKLKQNELQSNARKQPHMQSQLSGSQKLQSQQIYAKSSQWRRAPSYQNQPRKGQSQQSQKSQNSIPVTDPSQQIKEQQIKQKQSEPIWGTSILTPHSTDQLHGYSSDIEYKLQYLINSINEILTEMRTTDDNLQPTKQIVGNTCNKLVCVGKRNIAAARDNVLQRMKKISEINSEVSHEDVCLKECKKKRQICFMDTECCDPCMSTTTVYKEVGVGNTENIELNTSIPHLSKFESRETGTDIVDDDGPRYLEPEESSEFKTDKENKENSSKYKYDSELAATSTSKYREAEIEAMFKTNQENDNINKRFIETSRENTKSKHSQTETSQTKHISNEKVTNFVELSKNDMAPKKILSDTTGVLLSESTLDALNKEKSPTHICECKSNQDKPKSVYSTNIGYLIEADKGSRINEILDDEMRKSMEAKNEINALINDELYTPCGVQINIDIPCRDISTEVTSSLAKTAVQKTKETESDSENKTTSMVFPYQRTSSVNTDSNNVSCIWRLSADAIKGLLSFVPFISNLPLAIQTAPPRRCNDVPYICNICGAAFSKSSELSQHIERHSLSGARDCCVCRHYLTLRDYDVQRNFRCKYCGQCFLRAYCCELHMQGCARRHGLKHDVRESLATLK